MLFNFYFALQNNDVFIKVSILVMSENTTAHDAYTSAADTWADSLELWWKALSPSIEPDQHEVFRKFIEQGKSYFRLNSEFLSILPNLSNSDKDSPEWQRLWDVGMSELRNNFANLTNSGQSNAGFWALPLENWQRTLGIFSVLPLDFLKNLESYLENNEQGFFYEQLKPLCTLPNFNYPQEWQENLQESIRLLIDYQQAQQEYAAVFGKIGLRSIDLLQHNVATLQGEEVQFDNLRTVYDLWVECGETAYSEFVNSEEYVNTHARLINSLMTWKQHEQKMVDDILNMFNMPTRKEMDTINLRMHQMRREVKALQKEPNQSAVIAELQHEIKVLRAELETVKKAQKTPTRKTTPRKTTAKKPRTRKAKTTATQNKDEPSNVSPVVTAPPENATGE